MRLKPKIMLSVTLPLLVGVVVMVVVTGVFVSQVSNYLVQQSQSQIVATQQQSLTRRAEDKANLVEEYAALVTSDMMVLNEFTTLVINGGVNASYLPSYFFLTYGTGQSPQNYNDASVWYLDLATSPSDATPQMMQELNTTSIIDIHFHSILSANPNYVYVQIGFPDNLFKIFPFQDLSSYLTRHAICEATGQYINGYLPTCRPWYTAALSSPDVHFTAPYITSTQEATLVVAVTQAVYMEDSVYLVIALNFDVTAIQSSILNTTFLETGYAYVIDWNQSVVFHPQIKDYTKAVPPFQQLEFPDDEAGYEAFLPILMDMANLGNDTRTFTKSGKEWYISYYPAPSARYSLAIVVPGDEIYAPVNHFRSKTHSLLGAQIGVFVAVIIVTMIILLLIINFVAGRAVTPVNQLTDLCRRITRGDLEYDMSAAPKSSKEITAMYVTFGHLLTALRFGNEDFYKGNKEKAMANYLGALAMFTQFENKKGMGICYNNIGNIHRARQEFEKAEELYSKAIEFGFLLNDPPTIESQRALASRYNNLAMLYLFRPNSAPNAGAGKDYNVEAEKLLLKALELDNATLDYLGMISHYGNLALLCLKQDMKERAEEYMRQIDDVMRQCHPPTTEIQQKYEHVRNMFQEVYRNPGSFSNQVRPKDVFFLLDSSGSMSGAKNKAAVQGMRTIFTKNVTPADRVCLITFSSNYTIVFPLTQKGPEEAKINQRFDSLAKPEGGTAFFDALGSAFKIASENPSQNEQWVVALTDGDDNQSKTHSAETIQRIVKTHANITLIIIVVGKLDSREKLNAIAKASSKGMLMDVDDTDGVGHAIGRAFEEIGSMMDAGVETYNFRTDD